LENFKYKAIDKNGKQVKGLMPANSEAELHKKLADKEMRLLSVKSTVKTVVVKRMKSDKLSEFARNLGQLIEAGITLVRALTIVCEDETLKEKDRKSYQEILRLVRGGMTLSDALQTKGDTFPPLFINMIKSSEASGQLGGTLMQMADYYAKDHRLRQKIKSSMTYPKILAVLIVIVVAVIMGFVIPQFDSLFSQMDELPMATSMLLALSDFIAHKWYILIFGAFVLYVFIRILKTIPVVRLAWDRMLLKMPTIGKLEQIIFTARFARTLASLYSAGIPIVNCLTIAKSTIGNAYIESQFDRAISRIRSGENLSDVIRDIDGFTSKLSSSIMVGEETGALDQMLNSMSEQMEYDSEIAIEKLVSYIEPVMIVIMAVVVGFIMIAVIKPIYGSYQTIADSSNSY